MESTGAFRDDFSYRFYLELIELVRTHAWLGPLGRFADAASAGQRRVFLRHDIDLCLDSALALAEIEASVGVSATYMFIPTTQMYDLSRPQAQKVLINIQALGHEIALHFDVETSGATNATSLGELAPLIARQNAILEDIVGERMRSISFHRPLPFLLRGPDTILGLVNAYAESLMHFYRSDSSGRWRNGNPVKEFGKSSGPVAQLLTHPIWWSGDNQPLPLLLEKLFDRLSPGRSSAEIGEIELRLDQSGVRMSGRVEASSGVSNHA